MPAKICGNPADGKLLGSSQCKPFPALVPYWPNCAILACQGVTVPRELLACTLLFLVVSYGHSGASSPSLSQLSQTSITVVSPNCYLHVS